MEKISIETDMAKQISDSKNLDAAVEQAKAEGRRKVEEG